MNPNLLINSRFIFQEATPKVEANELQQVAEKVESFDQKVEALDKAFDEKSDIALHALKNLEDEFNKYLDENNIKRPKDGDQTSGVLGKILTKIIGIQHKIQELRASKDFSITEFEKTKLGLPEEAKSAGFKVEDNNTLRHNNDLFEFLPEEGVMTGLVWQNNELIVSTSKGLKFGFSVKNNRAEIREIK